MTAYTPHLAPLVTLLFLAVLFLAGLGLLAMVLGAVRRAPLLAGVAAAATGMVAGGYFFVVVGVSAISRDQVLPPGSLKYFCELDCHLAYSLVGSYETAALGPELKQTAAQGQFVVVEIKTWFDERTISPHRGDGPLTPNGRSVFLVDSAGRRFAVSREGEQALAPSGVLPLTESLRPGESYITELVFDVPPEARGLRLLLTEDSPETRFVIGHENSFLHRKIYLGLGPDPHSSTSFR